MARAAAAAPAPERAHNGVIHGSTRSLDRERLDAVRFGLDHKRRRLALALGGVHWTVTTTMHRCACLRAKARSRAMNLPVLPDVYRRLRTLIHSIRSRDHRVVFESIYRSNFWNDSDSRSGPGSNERETAAIRRALPKLLRDLDVHSLLDAPCGDFHWLSKVDLGEISYLGVDIVPEVIASNHGRFGNQTQDFKEMDVVNGTVPRADLILCRDCLVHFSFADALKTIRNFRASGSTYLLTTTFPGHSHNYDTYTGHWRPLNLCLPPFDLPPPLLLVNEECPQDHGRFADKSLGLWRLQASA